MERMEDLRSLAGSNDLCKGDSIHFGYFQIHLFVVDAENGKPLPLTPPTTDAAIPVWSPCGVSVYAKVPDARGGAPAWVTSLLRAG